MKELLNKWLLLVVIVLCIGATFRISELTEVTNVHATNTFFEVSVASNAAYASRKVHMTNITKALTNINSSQIISATPTTHQSTHQSGNSDALSGLLDANGRVAVNKNSGATVGTRRRFNVIEGANLTFTVADDAGNEEVDVTAAAIPSGADTQLQYNNAGAFAGAGTVTQGTNFNLGNLNVTNSVTVGASSAASGVMRLYATNGTNFVEMKGAINQQQTNTTIKFLTNAIPGIVQAQTNGIAGEVQLHTITGTNGQAVVHNGAGWAAGSVSSVGYVLTLGNYGINAGTSWADSQTYYYGGINSAISSVNQGRYAANIPVNGTIKSWTYSWYANPVATSENITVDLWINNTTSVGSTTLQMTTANGRGVGATGLSQAVTTSDYIELRFITPAWVTNPTGVFVVFVNIQ